jgi:DNA-binding beta-propeller fold protein YncE
MMATGAGSLWVGDALAETVYRIDPATNRVIAAVKIPFGGCGGLAANDQAVWSAGGCATSRDLTRIDPATNAVVKTIKLDGNVAEVALGHGAVWATTTDPYPEFPTSHPTLVKINPATNRVVAISRIQHTAPLDVSDDAVWLGAGNALLKIRP